MRRNVTLTIASLLTIVLSTLHVCDDALHARDGVDRMGISILLLIMLVMLYGTVELAGRRLGYVIILIGGAAAAGMPYLHGMGPNATRWGFFFVWTLFALGVTGAFTVILSARALWRSFRARPAARAVTPGS